ncbi:MAG: bifunctional riboflavin kinase/FAD synthetase [Bacteroidota bacterium]
MKIHYDLDSFEKLDCAVVTSGTFDGVHLGHQKILAKLKEITVAKGGESVLITFFPHPRMVLFNDSQKLKLLNTLSEKIHLLEKFEIDHLVIIPFTREFSEINSQTFIQDILVERIGAKVLVIGYDHRFGKNREGSFEYLKENASKFGFEVLEIPRQDIENIGISSTIIRNSILAGEVEQAALLLGASYSLNGKVVKGKQLGRTLGYPTANIYVVEDYKLIPAEGVYAVRIVHNHNQYNGVLNIGKRPTIEGKDRTIEVFIFDFDKEIYGENLTIHFVKKIREEIKFNSLDDLKAQIGKDAEEAKSILG